MALDGLPTNYGDFRDALNKDGYAVIKGAIPLDRATKYADEFYGYLEVCNSGLGYDRNDPSTVKPSNLPVINEKGMILAYGVTHEKWVWDIRGEPGVVDTFAQVYDDDDLIVSFDVVNVQFSNQSLTRHSKPWPHQDQDPAKPGFRCLQSLVNLNPCGPDDGGLIWFGFTDNGMKWLADHGMEWVKVCAEPGDLIIWDSRVPHYNLPPSGKNDRLAVYTSYMPVADASKGDLLRKRKAFEDRLGTTHWPNAVHVGTNVALRNGKPCPKSRERPVQEPVLTERAFKLTGIPYIEQKA
ncbi:hypothetical protein BDW66DRAFT_163293 [Aspergillus desertorum]